MHRSFSRHSQGFRVALAAFLWLLALCVPLKLAHWQHTRLHEALEAQKHVWPSHTVQTSATTTHFLAHQRHEGSNGWRAVSQARGNIYVHGFIPYGAQKTLPTFPQKARLSGIFYHVPMPQTKGLLTGPLPSGRTATNGQQELLRLAPEAFETAPKTYYTDTPPQRTLPPSRHRNYRTTWLLVALGWFVCGVGALVQRWRAIRSLKA